MAKLIPSRHSCRARMTGGEYRFSGRLEDKLSDEYSLWYDVDLGPKQRRPDFVVLHPRRGVLVLEVKDWKPETILALDRVSGYIQGGQGSIKIVNPMMQARTYAQEVAMVLGHDPALQQPPGRAHANKLCMPYGWGVVLANITRKRFEEKGLQHVLEPGHVICQDEMLESVTDNIFEHRLNALFNVSFPCALTPEQVDRVRWHLFPEVRVAAAANQFGLSLDGPPLPTSDGILKPAALPDVMRVMDLRQEALARSLGAGHRVIHGVAGSGKTMILGYRAVTLARTRTKPILVLCFNVTLAARLAEMMDGHGIGERVVVRHFHRWCAELLAAHHLPRPIPGNGAAAYTEALVATALAGLESGAISRGQYGAVLIDEGHDFEPDWFRLVVPMADGPDESVLLLYDTAQALYGDGGGKPKLVFSHVGIQARGRTTPLTTNYRNTQEVLAMARVFASDLLKPLATDEDTAPVLEPVTAGRRGPQPELVQRTSFDDEVRFIVDKVREDLARGRSASEIGVLFRTTDLMPSVEYHLRREGVPCRRAVTRDEKKALFQGGPAVKLVTMHSSKGLEFHTVFIPAAGQAPPARVGDRAPDTTDEARLLYVAMTRSTHRLVMTYHRVSEMTIRLEQARAATGRLRDVPVTGLDAAVPV